MKLFRKSKKKSKYAQRAEDVAGIPDESFYEQGGYQAPLSSSSGRRDPSVRTLKHRVHRKKERSNRATDRTLLFLVIKIFMLPVLIVGGYIALKMVLGRFVGPSDQDVEKWQKNAELMARAPAPVVITESYDKDLVNLDFIQGRLDQWNSIGQALRSSDALVRRGFYDKAIPRLKQVLKSSPDNRKVLRHLLDIYMKTEAYGDALPVCIHLLEQDDQQWDLKVIFLEVLYRVDELDVAVTLAENMLAEQPSDIDVLAIYGDVSFALGNMPEALDAYARILSEQEDNTAALFNMAQVYQHTEQWSQAVPYYLSLLELDPKPEVYRALAQCYARAGESGKSVIFLGQAVCLYGQEELSFWLQDKAFDSIRDTQEFRAFSEKLMFRELRKEFEEKRKTMRIKDEAFKKQQQEPGDLPDKSQLNLKAPGSGQ